MSTHPEAFVLLHIPEVTLSNAGASESGTLALECVTLAPDASYKNAQLAASLSSSDRSLILVLHLNSLELPLDPARAISLLISKDGTRTYTFHSDGNVNENKTVAEPSPSIRLLVPIPSRPDPHRAETVEALDHILAQYAQFDSEIEGGAHLHQPSPESEPGAVPHVDQPPEDLRGKLVLMDESTGDIVGELPNRVNITEDPSLAKAGKGKDGEPAPVMLELPPDVYDAYTGAGTSVVPYLEPTSELDEAREIFVRAIPPEDQDWMTKSATLISHAISSSTSLLLGGLTHASNYYINHSTPASPPSSSKDGTPPPPPPRALLLLSHPRTRSTLSRAYAISGQAVKVSQKTVAIVEDLIGRAVGADKPKSKPSSASASPQHLSPSPSLSPSTSASASTTALSALEVPSGAPPPYPGTPDGKPPLPQRRSSPAPGSGPGPAPALPPRSKSPLPAVTPSQVPLPPSGISTPSLSQSASGSGTPKPARTRDKLALSANLILATVDDSIRRTFDVSSERVTAVVGHKYGPEAAQSTHLATHAARNVTLVYIDMRGFARKALIRKAGKQWIKARVGGGREMSGLVVDKQQEGQKS